LFAPGRHVFIYGDRGVGKSSVAATAANQLQSSDAQYLDVACAPDATLTSLVANIAYKALKASRLRKVRESTSAGLDLKYLKLEATTETSASDLHTEIRSLIDAVEVLREVAAIHSVRPIVVVDEFDRMGDKNERSQFADLLKHLGDKKVDIKFIFTGVARSLDELLGAHQSAIRQLETIELPRLSWDARWDIVLAAADTFGVQVNKEIYTRIAAVSDGFPYYVHLLTEKLLWCVFEDPELVSEVTRQHYHSALRIAIEGISAELKRPYEAAVNQRSGDYEEVLWSTADSEFLHRYVKDMYSSYEYVMKQLDDRERLDYDKYSARIRGLRKKTCGDVLVADPAKPGLYSYREKMLRGYVRMQAEAHGVELIGEQPMGGSKQVIHVPASASRGYYTSRIPEGVHFGRKRKNDKD
jgi:AAA ATPase-like protein